LDLRFGRARHPYHVQDHIVVLECGQILAGLIVNEVLDVRNIAAHEVEPPPSYGQVSEREASFVDGIAKLDQGLAMLLHLPRLLNGAEQAEAWNPQDPAALPPSSNEVAATLTYTPAEAVLFRERAHSLRQPVEMHETEGLLPLVVIGLNSEYFAVDLTM